MAPLPEPGQDLCLVALDDGALMAMGLGSDDRGVYLNRGGEQGVLPAADLSVSGSPLERTLKPPNKP